MFPRGIHIVIRIAVAASAGVGGITLLHAGGDGDGGIVAVGMNGDIVRQGLGQIKGPGLVPILKGKTDPAILCHHSGFFVRPAAIREIAQIAAAVFIGCLRAGPLHDSRIFEGNNSSRLQIIIDTGACPAELVVSCRKFVAMDHLCLNDRIALDGFITPDMRLHDPGNHLMAGSIGVQAVGHILCPDASIRRIQRAFCVQIDHRHTVLCADGLQRIHIVAQGGANTVGNVIVRELGPQNLAGSKAIPMQGGNEHNLAGGVLGNKGGDNGIQRAVEGPILCVLHGAQGRFMTIVIGSHENDDQIRGGDRLITVDQGLITGTIVRIGADAGTAYTHGGHRVKTKGFLQKTVVNLGCTGAGSNAVTDEDGASAAPGIFLGFLVLGCQYRYGHHAAQHPQHQKQADQALS